MTNKNQHNDHNPQHADLDQMMQRLFAQREKETTNSKGLLSDDKFVEKYADEIVKEYGRSQTRQTLAKIERRLGNSSLKQPVSPVKTIILSLIGMTIIVLLYFTFFTPKTQKEQPKQQSELLEETKKTDLADVIDKQKTEDIENNQSNESKKTTDISLPEQKQNTTKPENEQKTVKHVESHNITVETKSSRYIQMPHTEIEINNKTLHCYLLKNNTGKENLSDIMNNEKLIAKLKKFTAKNNKISEYLFLSVMKFEKPLWYVSPVNQTHNEIMQRALSKYFTVNRELEEWTTKPASFSEYIEIKQPQALKRFVKGSPVQFKIENYVDKPFELIISDATQSFIRKTEITDTYQLDTKPLHEGIYYFKIKYNERVVLVRKFFIVSI